MTTFLSEQSRSFHSLPFSLLCSTPYLSPLLVGTIQYHVYFNQYLSSYNTIQYHTFTNHSTLCHNLLHQACFYVLLAYILQHHMSGWCLLPNPTPFSTILFCVHCAHLQTIPSTSQLCDSAWCLLPNPTRRNNL